MRDPGVLDPGVAEGVFRDLLSAAVRDTSSVNPAETVTVCGFLRESPDRFLVHLCPDPGLEHRYVVSLPLATPGGDPLNHRAVSEVVRQVETDRRNAPQRWPTEHLVRGDNHLTERGRARADWRDELRDSLTGMLGRPQAPADNDEIVLEGFVQYEHAWFRLYTRPAALRTTLGLDLPRYPSAGLHAELASLLADGISPELAHHEEPPDSYCARLLDLRSWF